ncbi:M50 family metallopeptidase [Aerosakkonemataceae cyanobacterium BLCC-F154]|uniref:M50 family metallopeptidase n=1 Tax=Floridaenema fluviatile BLCC-F154 TaxID=3153640 RepID=A0ABV4YAU2_9CYAN
MNPESKQIQMDYQNSICPDISSYWKLARIKDSDQVILQTNEGNYRLRFSEIEGYALRYFIGRFTINEIQNQLNQDFPENISPNLVRDLVQKLIALNIIAVDTGEQEEKLKRDITYSQNPQYQLKPCVQWIAHSDGYWILRNPEDVTFLQVSTRDKTIIEQLQYLPTHLIAEEYCISTPEIKYLLQLLAATGMLQGTSPMKPQRGKFNPLQLLFFKIRLFNPDSFLTQHIDKLRFIWTKTSTFILITFLTISAINGINQQAEILHNGQKIVAAYGSSLLIPFILLMALVVTLHELGHAFTLKHFGGIVPEVGLLFMFLIPAVYTNTSDSYCLSRFKRILVVGAGILVQFIIAAIAFWIYSFSTSGTWLSTSSILLLAAALFTVALNLNPLAKFDGYYLAVAITGINNLRSRAFKFYANLFTGKPIQESKQVCSILAIYAPFSLIYIWCVFGFLFWRVTDWSLTNIPITALMLLLIWGIYFLYPTSKK